jgi:hypothetical protein
MLQTFGIVLIREDNESNKNNKGTRFMSAFVVFLFVPIEFGQCIVEKLHEIIGI